MICNTLYSMHTLKTHKLQRGIFGREKLTHEKEATNRLRGAQRFLADGFMRIRLSRSLKLPVAEKRGRRVGRACETLACAYACPGILDTQSSSNKQEKERDRER